LAERGYSERPWGWVDRYECCFAQCDVLDSIPPPPGRARAGLPQRRAL